VSRRQEFIADELAAHTVGARPLIEGLKQIHSTAVAFELYWAVDFLPFLEQGYWAPFLKGFEHFLGSPRIEETAANELERSMTESEADPYDTHPTLRERVDAVKELPEGSFREDEARAISLFNSAEDMEARLMGWITEQAPPESVKPLTHIDWEEAGHKVWLPGLELHLKEHAEILKGVTPQKFPEVLKDLEKFVERLEEVMGETIEPEERFQIATSRIAGALSVALHRRQWALSFLPGREPTFKKGDTVINPYEVISDLAEGKLTKEAWYKICRDAGIADLDLGEVVGGENVFEKGDVPDVDT
jgi:hypothetical protein